MNRIKEVLEERGIKQTWLAEKLGKSFCMVNAYVCNRRTCHADMEYDTESNSEKLLRLLCQAPVCGSTKPSYWICVIDASRNKANDHPSGTLRMKIRLGWTSTKLSHLSING